MKDSGIEWIGEIPEDWEVIKFKRCFNERSGGAWGNDQVNNENDVICIRIADFDYPRMCVRNQDSYTKRNYESQIIQKLKLQKGDILIEKSGGGELTPVGRTIIFDKDFDALYANFIERVRVCEKFIPKFMQYIFVAFYKNNFTKLYIKQTTGIQNLGITSMFANERCVLPTIAAQQRIASYLDEKCKEIDSIVENTKATIEEYKKYKQSVITEAVTKGLDPNVEMKDSGVEWIGEIPKHWDIISLKYCIDSVESGTSVNSAFFSASEDEIGVLKTSCVYGNIFNPNENKCVNLDEIERVKCPVKKHTIIVSRMNTPDLVGACGYVSEDYRNLYLPDRLWQVFFYDGYSSKFIWYFLSSSGCRFWIASIATGTSSSMKNITQPQFSNIQIPLPKLSEQQQISDYLDKKCTEIDNIISQKQQIITELESYKKSLIYECVTGKLEV